MRIESFLLWRFRSLMLMVLSVACHAVWSVAFPPVRAEAGSLVVPAWSFARGNVQVYANPDKYADAGPVVGSGPAQPWGWRVEYDVDIPVDGKYTLQVCYAAAEARPVEVFFGGDRLTKCCIGVTFSSASSKQAGELTFNSSGAKWECVRNYSNDPTFGVNVIHDGYIYGNHGVGIRARLGTKGPCSYRFQTRFDLYSVGWYNFRIAFLGKDTRKGLDLR